MKEWFHALRGGSGVHMHADKGRAYVRDSKAAQFNKLRALSYFSRNQIRR